MTPEHRKYWLKLIFIPLEGLKDVGIVEKWTITSSRPVRASGFCFGQLTVSRGVV